MLMGTEPYGRNAVIKGTKICTGGEIVEWKDEIHCDILETGLH